MRDVSWILSEVVVRGVAASEASKERCSLEVGSRDVCRSCARHGWQINAVLSIAINQDRVNDSTSHKPLHHTIAMKDDHALESTVCREKLPIRVLISPGLAVACHEECG